jgi:hypothetical protein
MYLVLLKCHYNELFWSMLSNSNSSPGTIRLRIRRHNTHMLLPCPGSYNFPLKSTDLYGLPLANTTLPFVLYIKRNHANSVIQRHLKNADSTNHLTASSYVTSHIFTGFDNGKMMGRLLIFAILSTTGCENADCDEIQQ